ncbi:MAG TPA: HAMP domain-containing sensor histidine kinase, partial [Fibrobacteraceae bacterium]|nr:HAMP domain-containing sensor histidine kinase [Fibrobacteraceae bacterium]
MLNQRIYDDLAIEERRSYSEYRFIRAVPMIGGEGVTLSDLAHYPIHSHYAGMVGYFQMEPDGSIRTPVLPDGLLEKIAVENRSGREAVRDQIKQVLMEMDFQNNVVRRRVSSYPYVFSPDSLQPEKNEDIPTQAALKGRPFEKRYETPSAKEAIVFDVESGRLSHEGRENASPVEQDDNAFDVEIEPFQARFNSKYIVFYRNVWRSDQKFMQGFVVNLEEYLGNLVYKELQLTSEENMLRLEFHDDKKTLARFCSPLQGGDLLLNSPLQFPLQDMGISVFMLRAEHPPGSGMVLVLGLTMVLVLAVGLFGVYKITATQMRNSAKRQDFISAVSHELKTPLTAIRMYAELLQNQWVVKEEKRQHYYNMIASETERLARLIQNVLNISNLDRRRWPIHLQQTNPERFLDEFLVKYTPTIERAGFSLEKSLDDCDEEIFLDRDAMYQILMNLLENSFKFAKDHEPKKIQVGLRVKRDDMMIYVRDFGPGIHPSELGHVLQEFYRVENEMTRRTSGAGIGLSMVQRFAQLLNIRLSLINANPGLRAELHLPMRTSL